MVHRSEVVTATQPRKWLPAKIDVQSHREMPAAVTDTADGLPMPKRYWAIAANPSCLRADPATTMEN
jgi:hypothetical protein